MAEVSETLRAEIKRYQDLVERLRVLAINRQQIQSQLSELNDALRELGSLKEDAPIYKIVGSIMIHRQKDVVIKELNDLKEMLEIRLKALEKQEGLLKEQLEELEKKLVKRVGSAQTGAG
ncbi:MAG: prefoldin subunit beta [Thermofilaceae archaeon]